MGGRNGLSAGKGVLPQPSSASSIPPRDWKYWLMMVLSLVWFVVLANFLLKSAASPSMTLWWKARSQSEKASLMAAPDRLSSTAALKPSVPLSYPKQGDYYQLSFDVLAGFPAGTPDISDTPSSAALPRASSVKTDVPQSVRALDGRKISVVGFMIPMAMDQDGVSSFILAQSRMTCCYGLVPKLNQWIYVTMQPGKMTSQLMDVPITVYGTLGVGQRFDPQNRGWCLYRMVSDKVELPKKLWF